MNNGQTQKGGINSINQQSNNGGINQNAGGDIYNHLFLKPEQDLGIISDIFKYIFDHIVQNFDDSSSIEMSKILHLQEKIDVNFGKITKTEIEGAITRNWGKLVLVENFIQSDNEISPGKIDALILKIKSLYKEKKSCDSSEERVQKVTVIEEIANEFLPEDKKVNPDYFASSFAIVLYFFQMCEIGKRTNRESPPPNLFEQNGLNKQV